MSRHILAIYDSADYVNHFLMFIKNNKSVPFEAVGFTESENLYEYIRTHEVDIVLIPEEMAFTEGKGEMNRVKTVAYLGEQQDLSGKVKYLCKYRPAKLILSDLLDIFYSEKQEETNTTSINAQIYGIYSLDGSGDRMKLAMSLAGRLSKEGKVLYMNLERFSGIKYRFKVQTDAGLSDLIYYFRTDSELFRETIARAVTKILGTDTILAPAIPEDLDELAGEELGIFLEKISKEGNYPIVILDISDGFRNLIPVFDCCTEVYLLYNAKDEVSGWKKYAFREYFEECGREDILVKIREVL